ncbi:MAG: formylglycine-generating enzyme family protein [Planctomycetota bacterium]
MKRFVVVLIVITILFFCAVYLYSQDTDSGKEKLALNIEIKEAPGEITFEVSGTADLPDKSRLEVVLYYLKERIQGNIADVKGKKFSIKFGPYKKRYHKGTYFAEAIFRVEDQLSIVQKFFPDHSQQLSNRKRIYIGEPSKEKEEDKAIGDLYGNLVAEAETLRLQIWIEYEAALKKECYVLDDKFDVVAWREFLDNKWRETLNKVALEHKKYKAEFLAPKYPEAAVDAELLLGSLYKLSQNLSCQVYKKFSIVEDNRDTLQPDWDYIRFGAAANNNIIERLKKKIQKNIVDEILEKQKNEYTKHPEGMVLIPAGAFRMGTPEKKKEEVIKEAIEANPSFKEILSKKSFENNLRDEKEVYLKAYYIDKYEVTNRQYKKFVDAAGYTPPDYWDDANIPDSLEYCPVTRVSLKDAEAYAKWAGKRLPTEAEWEKAARGSKDTRSYPWGDRFSEGKANIRSKNEKERSDYKKVGSFSQDKSPYGCMDMSGNVMEWTYDTITIVGDVHHAGVHQVTRGGCYNSQPYEARIDWVSWLKPYDIFSDLGFRCVKDVEE